MTTDGRKTPTATAAGTPGLVSTPGKVKKTTTTAVTSPANASAAPRRDGAAVTVEGEEKASTKHQLREKDGKRAVAPHDVATLKDYVRLNDKSNFSL